MKWDVKSAMLSCVIRTISRIMKIFLVMVFMNLLILLLVSFLLPPLPVWLGGIIGVFVFLGVGNLVARFVE